jgi:6-phosphofructokinase 2
MSGILTVTLNPAVDIAAQIDVITAGRKLRCEEPHTDPGGGGVNVSRAIKILGGESTPFIAVGGPTGDLVLWLLEAEGIKAISFPIDGLTRQSFSVRETKSSEQYRFVLPGPEWSEEMAGRALAEIVTLAADKDYLVVSGSLSPGIPDDFYIQLTKALSENSVRVILDSSGSALVTTLEQSTHEIFCIRFNHLEADEIAKRDLSDVEEIEAFAHDLIDRKIAAVIIVTRGSDGVVLVSKNETICVAPPVVETISAVGGGDSFVAGFTLRLLNKDTLENACRYGVAAAASTMTTPATELCRRFDTDQYFEQITKMTYDK